MVRIIRSLALLIGCRLAVVVESFDVRLVGDPGDPPLVGIERGRLEVNHSGEWGTVCDDQFDRNTVQVACRHLGYAGGARYRQTPGTGPIWLDDLKCAGTESNLTECRHGSWGVHNCEHEEDVSLICYKASAEGSLDVRLMGGTDRGRVEVKYLGLWGTICDDGFGEPDARVVCRQLGHSRGVRYTAPHGAGLIWMDDLRCVGNESSIADCPHAGWGKHNCRHSEDVAVVCFNNSAEGNVSVRLTDGDHGRLEVSFAGEWGTVCDDSFEEHDASVVCRQLGHDNGGTVLRGAMVEPGSGPIWLDEVRCKGSEPNLQQCPHGGWGAHNCRHSEDVGVDCRVSEALLEVGGKWYISAKLLFSFGLLLFMGATSGCPACLRRCLGLEPKPKASVMTRVPAQIVGQPVVDFGLPPGR